MGEGTIMLRLLLHNKNTKQRNIKGDVLKNRRMTKATSRISMIPYQFISIFVTRTKVGHFSGN